MSAADSEAAVARVASKREALGKEGFAAYAFLVLGLLAHNQPEVAQFLLDQADRLMSGDAA